MQKLTYGDLKATVARACGFNVRDPRVMEYSNEAVRRLVDKGKWRGCTMRYQVCMSDGFITWPREIDTIELWALGNRPKPVKNEWYELIGDGPGIMSSETCEAGSMLIDRGTAATFDDISRGVGITRKLNVIARVTEADNQFLIVRGYDQDNQWIRTRDGLDWIDGEKIPISTDSHISANIFRAVTDVIKPKTNGTIDMYEYDPDLASNCKLLGAYEPDETSPIYRRSIIPGIENTGTNTACSDGLSQAVTVYCKLRHIPVDDDNDYFLIGNLSAIKYGTMAIKKEEQELPKKADVWWGKAITALELELQSYYGDGSLNQPRFQDRAIYGAGGVYNMV